VKSIPTMRFDDSRPASLGAVVTCKMENHVSRLRELDQVAIVIPALNEATNFCNWNLERRGVAGK